MTLLTEYEHERLCVFCHDSIPSVLTISHRYHGKERRAKAGQPGIDETRVLCGSCHNGLLHYGIISHEEVSAATDATSAGTRKLTHDEVYRQIKADLAAGLRRAKANFNNSTKEEKSEAAYKAHATRNKDRQKSPATRTFFD